jgi:hypothetical protein
MIWWELPMTARLSPHEENGGTKCGSHSPSGDPQDRQMGDSGHTSGSHFQLT